MGELLRDGGRTESKGVGMEARSCKNRPIAERFCYSWLRAKTITRLLVPVMLRCAFSTRWCTSSRTTYSETISLPVDVTGLAPGTTVPVRISLDDHYWLGSSRTYHLNYIVDDTATEPSSISAIKSRY